MIHAVWNAVLYRPIINLLAFLISVIPGGDVGVAIIILTIIVKLVLYPISKKGIDGQIKSAEMQAKINKIAPEIDKIKKSGASREEQAKLTMELHKKHDIDTFAALSGCLVQIPILIVILALFAAFRSGMNFDNGILYSFVHIPVHINNIFLGVIDISQRSLILAVLGAISQYIVALSMPKPPAPPSSDNSFSGSLNKSMGWQMKYLLPVFIFIVLGTNLLGISLSGAIALYYITNNLFTAGQQAYESRKRNVLALESFLGIKFMHKDEVQNLIKELVEKITVKVNNISVVEDKPKSMWVSVEVSEPHFFISREGEGLQALNHIIHRMIENKTPSQDTGEPAGLGIIVDVNDFQKKRVESVRAVAHMMSERARYFKSNIEVDPMSAFERRIVHEFLSDAADLKTESVGMGPTRRVVIKYVGAI